jgi:hypothetical protein
MAIFPSAMCAAALVARPLESVHEKGRDLREAAKAARTMNTDRRTKRTWELS